jgi:lysophospholipase L1-like esterase
MRACTNYLNRRQSRTALAHIICISAMGNVGLSACMPASRTGRSLAAFAAQGPSVKIFCYGDSLTAGWHEGGLSLTPYAPKLQDTMREILGHDNVMVRHRGLPGWTASAMLDAADDPDNGLRGLLRKIHGGEKKEGEKHAIAACVIIAGTNDLAYSTSSDEIAESILGLHSLAHREGVATVSVDIPESAAALMQKDYGSVRKQVNDKLMQTALSDSMCLHVPCPVVWRPPNQEGGEMWEPDGLHMSGAGYEALGMGLAPSVVSALSDLRL